MAAACPAAGRYARQRATHAVARRGIAMRRLGVISALGALTESWAVGARGLRCSQEIPADPQGKRRVGMNG